MKRQDGVQAGGKGIHNTHLGLIGLIFLGLLIFPTGVVRPATDWTGLGGANDDWSYGVNWSGLLAPLPTDVVTFNAADSGNTNVVNTDFTIAGLQYLGNGTHTTDFASASNLQVNGPVYVGYGGSGNGATVTWTNGGTVQIGDPLNLQTFYVGANTSSATVPNAGSLLLDGPVVDAHVSDLTIGGKLNSSGFGTADGSLVLGSNSSLHVGTVASPVVVNVGMNQSSSYYATPYGTVITSGGDGSGLLDATQGAIELHLSELDVGRHTGYFGTATGTLRWDQPTPIDADAVYFGRGPSTGILEVPVGGTFRLGTSADPLSLLAISYNDTGAGSGASSAHLDFRPTNPTFEAFVSTLTIGGKMNGSGYGTADGSLVLGSNSSLHVGTVASPVVVNVGMNQSSSYYATPYGTVITSGGDGSGLLDATQGAIELHLSELDIGRHTGYFGTATGTLRWDQPTPIDADAVYFGRGPSTGILEVPVGGTFRLGTSADPLSLLAISYNDTGAGSGASSAHLDFRPTNPTFEAFVSTLTIGGKMNGSGYGTADGSLVLGSNSSLHVGTVAAPGVVNVGMNQSYSYTSNPYGTSATSGGDGSGLLDATQGAIELHLSELDVGRHTGYFGTATGTLRWDQPTPIDADAVYFGRGPSTGILEVPVGGTFRLGTSADPLSLLAISYNDTGAGSGASSAHLDFRPTNPTFEAFVSTLTIGGKMNGSGYGTADGSLVLGSNSSLHVGTVAAPGVVNVGMNQSYSHTSNPYGTSATSGGDGTGLLDATEGDMQLHLTQLNVGLHTGYYGTTTGTFMTGERSVVTTTTANVGVTNRGTANGTVNLAGGLFSANTINMGAGGTFNFTGGRLAVNTYNSYGNVGTLLQQGGTLAPGFSLSDRLNTSLAGRSIINGNYGMDAGLLEIELFGKTAGTGYDQLQVNGLVNLNGGALDLHLDFRPAQGDEFIIINNDGTDAVVGQFASLPQGAWLTETYGGLPYNFSIDYYGLTGNDVVLRAGTPPPPPGTVPAPGALLLAGIGAGLLGWLRRRRVL